MVFIIIKGVTAAGSTQRLGGLRKKGKTVKHGNVGVKRKWLVLVRLPYSAQGEPREPVKSKAERTSETAGAFQIHSHKTRITRARTI